MVQFKSKVRVPNSWACPSRLRVLFTFSFMDDDDQELKNICWGSAKTPLKNGWLRGIRMNEASDTTAYGIRLDEGVPKAFLMIVQGVLLKHLLFSEEERRKVAGSVFK